MDQFFLNFVELISDRKSQNPLFILVTGDFNTRSLSYWKDDLTTSEGNQVHAITSSYGLSQIICEPTHILPNLSSCIDLIFINQNNFIMDSGVHTSLPPNSHHQIGYAKLNLKTEYPPLYERLVWDYKKTKLTLNCSILQSKPSTGKNDLKIRMLMSSYISSARPCLIIFKISFQIRI